MTRREFTIRLAEFAGALVLFNSKVGSTAEVASVIPVKKKGPKLFDENSPSAKGLMFVQDATKSAIRKNPQATCENCRQWMKSEKLVDGIAIGKCTMFPGSYTKAIGWCLSWTKNPKVA